MNISSAIVKVNPENLEEVNKTLGKSDLCEVHHKENGKLIIVIEGNNSNDEIKKMRAIEAIEKVLSVELIYSYSENEIENNRSQIEQSGEQPEWLNDETIDASNIPYNGNLKKKF